METSKLKVLRVLNIIAIAIPSLLCLLAIFEVGLLVYAALSTLITGVIQVLIALVYWNSNKKDILINIYFAVLLLFTLLVFSNIADDTMVLPIIPLVLCIYLSYIIHFKKVRT